MSELRLEPWLLSLASAALCGLLVVAMDTRAHHREALDHELRRAAASPERVAQRFVHACAAGQRPLARQLTRDGALACPALPRTLQLRVVFHEGRRRGESGVRLAGEVVVRDETRALRVDVVRVDARWSVDGIEIDRARGQAEAGDDDDGIDDER